MKPYQALLFDMDGVLINSELYYYDQLSQILKGFGHTLTPEFYASLLGTSDLETSQRTIDHYHLNLSAQDLVDIFYKENKARPLNVLDIAMEGVENLLKAAKAKGVKMVVASSSPYVKIDAYMTQLGWKDYFDDLVSGEEFSRSKPDPTIFIESAKRLHVPCERCLVIEDAPHGITAANHAGMDVVALRNPAYPVDLSKATYQVDSLQEIVDLL